MFFVQRLAKAVLSPKLPNWRLIPVETRAARLLLWLVFATVAFTGIDVFLSSVYQVLGSPLTLTVVESLVATVLTGIPVILMGLVRPFADEEGRPQPWHPLLRAALYLLGGLTIVAALLGYIGFARFIVDADGVHRRHPVDHVYRLPVGARGVAKKAPSDAPPSGGGWSTASSLIRRRSTSWRWWSASPSICLIAVIGLPLILFMWGFQPGDIQAWIYKLATGIRIGSVTISLTGILTGILVFILVYFVSRWFQGWLDGSVHGARPRRCRRAQFDPHRGRLCRHPARRPARRFGGRHRHVEHRAGRRRAVARHRLRPAEHRLELRLRA